MLLYQLFNLQNIKLKFMKFQKYLIIALGLSLSACTNNSNQDPHNHEHSAHPEKEVHSHDAHQHDHSGHSHNSDSTAFQHDPEVHKQHDGHAEAPKLYITSYSDYYEVFAEADPFSLGERSNIIAHFSSLPNFRAIERGEIKARLIIEGQEVNQELRKPTSKGIYKFKIKPSIAGKGKLIFDIKIDNELHQITVENIEVYACAFLACAKAEEAAPATSNTSTFTKEQSWKVDFASELPRVQPFGQIIKTTAQIQSAQGDEILIAAKTNGIVILSGDNILEGKSVKPGQILFSISGKGLANNNSSVQYSNAKSNYERAKSDYNRMQSLAEDKIVSEKELLNAKNIYDNAKTNYDNLNRNFNSSGQKVKSSMGGYVKQIFVQNGQYVEAGQPIIAISKNKTLLLKAEVQQKFAPILSTIQDANIRTIHDNKTFTLNQLNGKVISYGRNTNSDNYLIPITLQIDNVGSFISGSFVEVYLKSVTNYQAITVSNSSLLEEQGHFFVFVQLTGELFEKREVQIGGTDGLRTEVTNGLNKFERVVSKGAVLIKLAQASGALDAHSGHVH